MSLLNTLTLTGDLLARAVDFALEDHFVRDRHLHKALQAIWSGPPEHGGLGSDLWVEGAFPAQTSERTLANLVDEGVFHSALAQALDKSAAFPRDRWLYSHQLESLRAGFDAQKTAEKPAIVVTAGTGAGKTESFLLPLLDDLQRHPPTVGEGVSAIILYPMNALVNDQVGRIAEWLREQEELTFFHFTSETQENFAAFKRQMQSGAWPPCRFRTRQQARGLETAEGKRTASGPVPRIVITNYSMLEYMLCRPQDAVFFGRNLRALVLDEAHLYTGNLAAELALLQRRLFVRCGVRAEDVVQFATSATIGTSEENAAGELHDFAARLFSKPKKLVRVFIGQRSRHELTAARLKPKPDAPGLLSGAPPEETTLRPSEGKIEFGECTEAAWAAWREWLPKLAPAAAVNAAFATVQKYYLAPLLAQVLTHAPLLRRLQDALWQKKRLRLQELAVEIFATDDEASQEATRLLLQLGATARHHPGDYPLVPNRLHSLLRGPDGFHFHFASALASTGLRPFSGGCLESCGADPLHAITAHPLTLTRCKESGEWLLAGIGTPTLNPVPDAIIRRLGAQDPNDESNVVDALRFFVLEKPDQAGAKAIHFNPATGEAGPPGNGTVKFWEVEHCPRTGQSLAGHVDFFISSSRLLVSVLVEAALAGMPEYPAADRAWKPAAGRRLLAFSDSRAEAARLGPRLTVQHERLVFRAAVVEVANEIAATGTTEEIAALEGDVLRLENQLRGPLSPALQAIRQRELNTARQTLAALHAGLGVNDWAAIVRQSARLAELFDREDGQTHRAQKWDQKRWQEHGHKVRDRTYQWLARELARPASWPNQLNLESLGLLEVTYPSLETLGLPDGLAGRLPSPTVADGLRNVWSRLLGALCDTARSDGVLTLGANQNDEDFLLGRELIGKWMTREDKFTSRTLAFIGQRARRNTYVTNILLKLRVSETTAADLARDILAAAFDQLYEQGSGGGLPWLKVEQQRQIATGVVHAWQIDFASLALRRPTSLWQCELSGQVWTRSVLGCAPSRAPRQQLREVSQADLDKDPQLGRRRRELAESPVFKIGLWAEEHSAQLDPRENARLQELFKGGIRNILSSTTTLELGIDIGGLSGVFLANLPPGKASYLQRAGRAGRRADGSSVVLGFARPMPYERELFLHFGDFLSSPLRRPTVALHREELARRHGNALLLGQFFAQIHRPDRTGAMEAFGRMGSFCRLPLPPWLDGANQQATLGRPSLQWEPPKSAAWVPKNFAELGFGDLMLSYLHWLADHAAEWERKALKIIWMETACEPLMRDWKAAFTDSCDQFREALEKWTKGYNQLRETWEQFAQAGDLRGANALRYQLQQLHRITVIEALADSLVLPRYGFPIGVSNLRVKQPSRPRNQDEGGGIEDQFRLQRDSLLALREYVPGSQLLVGGKVVTSRGLLKHWTGQDAKDGGYGLRGQFIRNSRGWFAYSTTGEPELPEEARQIGGTVRTGSLIFPRFGFTTAEWDPPRWGDDFERVGHVETVTVAFEDAASCEKCELAAIPVLYRAAGELLVLNSGANQLGYAICQNCGYAESEAQPRPGRVLSNGLPPGFEFHRSLFASERQTARCWKSNALPVWRSQWLAARMVTNLARFDLSRWLRIENKEDRIIARTLAQALRVEGSKLLGLDVREIRALDPTPIPGGGLGLIFYDSLAGGSGHIEELLNLRESRWIRATQTRLELNDPSELPSEANEREVIRRILTADFFENGDEYQLLPAKALKVLNRILGG